MSYTKKDFQTDQEVRWCPGCGDYAILNALQQVFPTLGIPREKFVVVSGIGCSSRLPYYVNTYGFHTIHGRAPAVATGVKIANPELNVWVATGDGDALSIGGNHLIHALRRNVGLKILLFDNRIYGLTKGQYSPTSELGKLNKSAPYGTVDQPLNPISLALAAEATFIARSVDVYQKHLMEMMKAMAAHEGSALLQIYQNCNVFNDGAFDSIREKDVRDDMNVVLEHGKPLVFGKNRDRGIRFNGRKLEVVPATSPDLVVHDETDGAMAYMLSRMAPPEFPVPMGVFRRVKQSPLEARVHAQIAAAKEKAGAGDLRKLLFAGDLWEVK
jgi:2-oxoglutarate/2-oxoacid ferredoxin oxidoreductase subunit beta